jgi:hypothetical protein
MHTALRAHRRAAWTVATSLLVLVGACGDDDADNATGSPSVAETSDASEATTPDAASDDSATSDATNPEGGGEECSLVDVGTVEDLFAIEVTTVEQPLPGHCFFGPDLDAEIPNAGVTVLRNDLGQALYDEFAAEIGDTGEGSGGSGIVEADVGDEATAAPGPNAVDLAARRGDVNVRVTAIVSSDSPLSQDDLLAAATELATSVLEG